MPEEKKTAARRIVMVKVINDVQFLGVNGKQLAVGQNLKFAKVQEGVAVSFAIGTPGPTYVVYAANIAHVKWEEVDE